MKPGTLGDGAMGSLRPAATGPGQALSPAIAAQGLTKRYGPLAAVEGLSMTVPRGAIVGFLGPNGAGKTTTIRMLLGLVRPTAGTATVLGIPLARRAEYLPGVGALIETPAFYAHLSAEANLRVLCDLGGHDHARVPVVLKQLGLADRAKEAYKGFSLGMKQRLGIAAALLPDPELLVLDEPTNGLDPAGIHEVRDFLRSLADQGKTVFVSSHLLAEVQKMCDHVVVLRKGRLVFQGPVADLVARGARLTLAPEDPADAPRLASLLRGHGHQVDVADGRLTLHRMTLKSGAALNRAAAKEGITLREIAASPGDLEQTFLELTGGETA